MARILVVDDERSMREFLEILLEGDGHDVVCAADVDAAQEAARSHEPDVVLSDLKLPGGSGIDILRWVRSTSPDTQVIMMTAFGTTENAVEAMRMGAYDYQTKPLQVDEIRTLVHKALEKVHLIRDNRELSAQLQGRYGLTHLVTTSKAMAQVAALVQKIAPSRANVLIEGESGTGKELVARSVHEGSPRAAGPFIAINCGAIPDTLIEAELFGHAAGAFTGATRARGGLFEAAHGGTILLDEIADLPLSMQVKLLRVLQERVVRRIGEERERPIDVRIVAATNKNLEQLSANGEFREDLFYRLNVVRINVPPLRERHQDVAPLVQDFLRKFAEENQQPNRTIEPAALRALERFPFPGNVRELENYIERAMALATGDEITVADLPSHVTQNHEEARPWWVELPELGMDMEHMLCDIESELILKALQRTGGVKKRAGELLGLSFRSMRYRCKKLGIAAGDDPADVE